MMENKAEKFELLVAAIREWSKHLKIKVILYSYNNKLYASFIKYKAQHYLCDNSDLEGEHFILILFLERNLEQITYFNRDIFSIVLWKELWVKI